nr:MAG TPA: hypothetical protein [Caudoviricetes sp.]
MKYDKKIVIDGLKRTIEQNEEKDNRVFEAVRFTQETH